MTTATLTEAPVTPPPLVLVRSDVPGKPLAWIDPTPLKADKYGHVWTYNDMEPSWGRPYCVLCCETELDDEDATRPCLRAELKDVINEDRNQWIAEHRVEGVTAA